jgi:hypothetical protein
MKLTTAETKTTRTKTGTITVADLRAKFRIPQDAVISDDPGGDALVDDVIVATVTHVIEAAK